MHIMYIGYKTNMQNSNVKCINRNKAAVVSGDAPSDDLVDITIRLLSCRFPVSCGLLFT